MSTTPRSVRLRVSFEYVLRADEFVDVAEETDGMGVKIANVVDVLIDNLRVSVVKPRPRRKVKR